MSLRNTCHRPQGPPFDLAEGCWLRDVVMIVQHTTGSAAPPICDVGRHVMAQATFVACVGG